MSTQFLDDTFKAVAPLEESAAYEALFDRQGQTFKTLAESFKTVPELLPSDLVPPKEIEEYKKLLREVLKDPIFRNFGIRINNTAEYPERLRDARYPIELIYFRGNWDLIHTKSVAIVGSRKPSDEGIRRAKKLSHELVNRGYTIASGLASGIDRTAHLAAIASGGKTIGVLGTPINEYYPKENSKIQEFIAQKHLLISQVPFIRYSHEHFKNKRIYFPERNKLMSAISEATIIVEASETSGTLVQARAALEQNRKLFILDSNFSKPGITWPHKFLEKGAIRVRSIEDVQI